MYEALDIVSREMVGFVPAVTMNASAEKAAKDQSILVPVVPTNSAADITPAQYAPNTGDATVGNVEIKITKSRGVPVRWNGEETRGLQNAGTYSTINRDRFAQAIRTLVNEIESDLGALYVAASRAYGTAGTTPFATAGDLSDAAQVRKILEDNGVQGADLQLVLGSAEMAKIRGLQSVLFKVNEAGTDQLLRQGVIGQLEGFNLRNSYQRKAHTAGTGTGYLVNNAATEVAGQTTITTDTGSGTIIAGDIVTFAGTTDKYVVTTALSAGDFVIGAPGLLVAEADNDAITVGAAYKANMAFARSAIQLVTRAPAAPEGGDMADDRVNITDPISGLTFEVSLYRQYRQVFAEVAIAWGVKCIKPEHLAILLG